MGAARPVPHPPARRSARPASAPPRTAAGAGRAASISWRAMLGCGLWMSTATSTPAPPPRAPRRTVRRSAGSAPPPQIPSPGPKCTFRQRNPQSRTRVRAPSSQTRGSSLCGQVRAVPVRQARLDAVGRGAGGGAIHRARGRGSAAEHLVDRQARGLSRQIPEGHVDAADRAHGDRATLIPESGVVHRLPQRLGMPRIPPRQQRLETADLRDHRLGMILEVRLAQPDQALVGVDLQPHPARRHPEDLEPTYLHRCPRAAPT